MASDRMAYDTLQTAMARQRVTVYDLYGLLGVSPNVVEGGLRDAYEAVIKKAQPNIPSNAISVAYSVLINPAKRAQYDRDRLEYLYNHFATHAEFPAATANNAITDKEHETTSATRARDEQIQVYATELVGRVRDPIEHKKTAMLARIARTRSELDDFNERSARVRQDWATSPNQVLRMAANALRDVVVCAEEDVCMLEDELGRLEGILEPTDEDGPAGRIMSGRYGYGSEGPLHHVHQRIPSLPRSPTMPVQPQSASKIGVQGEDDSSEDTSPVLAEAMVGDRVNNFLLGPTATAAAPTTTVLPIVHPFTEAIEVPTLPTQDKNNNRNPTRTLRHIDPRDISIFKLPGVPSTVIGQPADVANDNKNKKSDSNKMNVPVPVPTSPSTLLNPVQQPKGTQMGLVEWQLLHGARAVSASAQDDKDNDNDPFWTSLNIQHVTIDPSPASTTASTKITNPFADAYILHSNTAAASIAADNSNTNKTVIEPMFRRPNRQAAERPLHPTLLKKTSAEEGDPGAGACSTQPVGGHLYNNNNTTTNTNTNNHQNPAAAGAGAANAATPSLAPGAGPLPSVARSAGIKDFQVRVWTAANAARAGSTGYTGNNTADPATTTTTTTTTGNAADDTDAGADAGADDGGEQEQARRKMLADEVKRLQESICVVRPPRDLDGVAAERSNKGQESKKEEKGAVKRNGDDEDAGAKIASVVAAAAAPASASAAATATATATTAGGGTSEKKDVFRRSKMGTVGRRTPMELDDPFI